MGTKAPRAEGIQSMARDNRETTLVKLPMTGAQIAETTSRSGRRWTAWALAVAVILGTGLIAANAGHDAGKILTNASPNAQFTYRTVLLMLLVTVALVIVREMCSRLGVYNGEGLRGLIREQFSAAPDGTVTIMFSDIEGSTALSEQLGDERWLKLLRRHNALIRRQLAAHRGFEVKSQGDGFMVAFGSARSALRCAIAIQRDLAARHDQSGSQVLRVRIGLHTGEVIREQQDFFGHTVILAARIGAKANGGQILVSALLRGLVAGSHEFQFGEAREEQLKGLRDPRRVYEVCWR